MSQHSKLINLLIKLFFNLKSVSKLTNHPQVVPVHLRSNPIVASDEIDILADEFKTFQLFSLHSIFIDELLINGVGKCQLVFFCSNRK